MYNVIIRDANGDYHREVQTFLPDIDDLDTYETSYRIYRGPNQPYDTGAYFDAVVINVFKVLE